MIQPLGNQIIIRTLPPESWKGIIIPATAQAATITGDKGAEDAVHFVEAEVLAVGPGERVHDSKLVDDLVYALRKVRGYIVDHKIPFTLEASTRALADLTGLLVDCDDARLIERAHNPGRVALSVKAGDRVLYHPAVQKFDRQIDGRALGLGDGDLYIVGEHSIMAVL